MKLTDEVFAIVDQDGVRFGGYENKMKLFETEVGANRQLECFIGREKRIQELYPTKPKRTFSVVKLTFKVVIDEKI